MLSRLAIGFLPKSKHLLISWLESPSAVILEPKKINFPLFPHLFAMKWWDWMPWSWVFEWWGFFFFLLDLGILFFNLFSFIYISWRLITLQYCSGFCHTLILISHRFTCVPHPEPPSHFPPYPIPLGHPSAPAPSTCLMHQTWTGNLFHNW